jgi:hypothetical protein
VEAFGKEINNRMTTQALNFTPSFGANTYVGNVSAGIGGVTRSDVVYGRHANNSLYYLESAEKAIQELSGKAANDNSQALSNGHAESVLKTAGKAANDNAVSIAKGLTQDSKALVNYSFLHDTLLDKAVGKYLKPETANKLRAADKNFLSFKFVRDGIENLSGGQIAEVAGENKSSFYYTAEKGAEASLKSKLGHAAADIAGTTTKFGLGLTCLAEVPDLYRAYKNDDLGNQGVRSAIRVPVVTATFGAITHLASAYAPAKIKTICKVGGAVAGSIMASKATDKVVDKFLGETIQKQKERAKEKLELLKELKMT